MYNESLSQTMGSGNRLTLASPYYTNRRSTLQIARCCIFLCVVALLAASCGAGGPPPIAWTGVPADGKCRSGLVLRTGDECQHEYFYRSGTRISEDGVEPIFESISNRFYVDGDGVAHYERLSTTNGTIRHSLNIGERSIVFEALAQSDGTFYIQEAT